MAPRHWVVNASPLILLGKVEQIQLLSAMAGQIAMPRAVIREVSAKPRPPRIYFFLARKRLNSSQNRRFLDVSSDEGGFGLLDNCEEMYL